MSRLFAAFHCARGAAPVHAPAWMPHQRPHHHHRGRASAATSSAVATLSSLSRPSVLVCVLLLQLLLHPQGVGAVLVQYTSVPNAFNASSTAVRAIFPTSQLFATSLKPERVTPLVTTEYVVCRVAAGAFPVGVSSLSRDWCTSYGTGILVNQTVAWSTLSAPGVQLRDRPGNTTRGLAWDCLTYACDAEDFVAASTVNGINATITQVAVGGLGVAAECCGSSNSTFVLYTLRGLIVQAATLPVANVNTEAAALYSAYVDSLSKTSSSLYNTSTSTAEATSAVAHAPDSVRAVRPTATSTSASMSKAMDYCLVRLLPPYVYANNTRTADGGDSGLVFAVDASICGVDLSDRIDAQHATLAMRGYTAVLTTVHGVEGLTFPKELIVGIASWVAARLGTASGESVAGESLLRKKGLCSWGYNASLAVGYRDGTYLDCLVNHSAVSYLPPLVLSVRGESIVSTADTMNSCSIAIELTRCLRAGGYTLRFFSSGSIVEQLALHKRSMPRFREPVIAIGVQELVGATVAVTRAATIAKWMTSGFNVGAGLPLLYLGVPRGTAVAADAAASGVSCVADAVCEAQQTFYPSMNLCATEACTNVLLYAFDEDTFTCSPRSSIVGVFSAMCLALLVAEGVVLHLQRRVEQAKEDHMRLVLQVQRRNVDTQ